MTASVSGDRYLSNDVNHLVGPALIREEVDDSVGHVPSHCCLLGTMSSVSVIIIIIIIKLYLDTVNSGTAVPFTGVYTH